MKISEYLKDSDDMTSRKKIRRLMWRWGRVPVTCARKLREIKEYQTMIDTVADLQAHSTLQTGYNGAKSDPTARAVERLTDLQGRFTQTVLDLTGDCDSELEFMREMNEVIDELDQAQQQIVFYRYKDAWSWDMIAVKMGLSEESVRKTDQRALDALSEKILID